MNSNVNSQIPGSSPIDPFSGSPTAPLGDGTTKASTPPSTPTSTQTPSPTPTPTKSPSTATGTIPSNVQVFEGTDFIDQGDVIIQQFVAIVQQGARDSYQAYAQHPSLLVPTQAQFEALAETGVLTPFEPSAQKATNKFFQNLVRTAVAKKEQKDEAPTSTPTTLENVFKGAPQPEKAVKSAHAKLEEKGGERPVLPQIEAHVGTIMQAVASGKTETLSKEDQKIVKDATQETQEAWGLPATWSFGTQEVKDWTPVEPNAVDSITLNTARKEYVCSNMEELLRAIDRAGTKVSSSLPPDDPQRVGIQDLIIVIARAIQDLKSVLQDIQIKDAEISSKLAEAKYDQIKDRDVQLEDMSKKMEEAIQKRKEQAKTSKIMKIFGPIISAIIIIVGVVSLPFTAGASTGLIVAGIVVATVMLAYTVADSLFNVTSKILKAVGAWLQHTFPGENNAWKRMLVKVALLVVMAVILVAAVVSSGGSAAANVATATASQIAKQAVLESIKQLSIQFSLMAIMSSNILPELILKMLIGTGAIDKNDEKTQMILKMAVMAVTMVAMLAFVAKGDRMGLGNAFAQTGNAITNSVRSIGEGVKNVTRAIKEGIEAAQQMIMKLMASLSRMLTQLRTNISTLQGLGVSEAIQSAASKVTHLADEMSNLLRVKVSSLSTQFADRLEALGIELQKAYEELAEKIAEFTQTIAKFARESLNQATTNLTDAIKSGIESIKSFSLTNELNQTAKDFINGWKFWGEDVRDISTWPPRVQDAFRATGLAVEIVGGIYIAKLGMDLAKIYEDMGEIAKAEEITKMLIKLFDQLLASFQEGISERSEWLASLDGAINSVFASGQRIINNATQGAI